MTREDEVVEYVESVSPTPIIQEETEKNKNEEKITLDTEIESQTVSDVRDWAVRKIELLHEADRHRNAKALAAEFNEWINIPDGIEELEYLSIENEEWTDEQEIDIR